MSFCFLQVFRCRRRVKSHIDLRSIRQIDRNDYTSHRIYIIIYIYTNAAASILPAVNVAYITTHGDDRPPRSHTCTVGYIIYIACRDLLFIKKKKK